MPIDKYTATWVSHSSIGDFVKCPRAYYLHNVYKDQKTRRKINLVSPALSLGQAVHEVLEGLIRFRTADRFSSPLLDAYEIAWKKVSGRIGGFNTKEEETLTKERGRTMLERVEYNPGVLKEKTIQLASQKNDGLPSVVLSEDDGIILCGKIDWIVYMEDDDSIRVLDFKTGKHDEKDGSLQLPIYHLLLDALQKRPISGAYYWYIDRDDAPKEVSLPPLDECRTNVLAAAQAVKEARDKREFSCPRGYQGCFSCRPYEKIIRGEAEYVGVGQYNQDLYMVS